MTEGPKSQALIRFGVFELDTESGELRKQGIRVRLQEQPFQILQILLERPGRVVTRDEMQRRIWPSDTFVGFDTGLYNAVKKLREALGDSSESPRFIETLSRRGYRFIAPVNGAPADRQSAPGLSATHDSIVVLPFINISTDSENEFFADGITEEVINALAQIKEIHVVARSSAFSFKGKHIDPRVVGQQLNVRTVLEGSVRKAGDRLRITAQLINVADGYHLWSERYDRELKDIFAIQDEIARAITTRLKLTLEAQSHEVLVKPGTKNLEAYAFYSKGRALLPRRGPATAYLDCFSRAVALDPDYALAWAGLADSYTVLGYSGLVPPEGTMSKALEAARRAVALDSSLAEAHNALAMASLMGAWDKAAAEREFLCALRLNPGYVQARTWYAMYYLMFSEGRMAEAMTEAKLALQPDPLSSYAHTMYGFICGYAGEHAQSIEACRRAVELDSESYLAHFALQEVLRVSGRLDESIAVGELALSISGRHAWAMTFLANAFADCGRCADADAVYAEMLARTRRQYVAPAPLAATASAAGREDDAMVHAREAFNRRDPECLFFFSRYAPLTDRLYAYPRFRDLLSEVGFE